MKDYFDSKKLEAIGYGVSVKNDAKEQDKLQMGP